jgi:hypothetical protein
VNANDQMDFRYFTKTKWDTEMKLVPLEGELQNMFLVHGRSNITVMMSTRRAVVDMAVK